MYVRMPELASKEKKGPGGEREKKGGRKKDARRGRAGQKEGGRR